LRVFGAGWCQERLYLFYFLGDEGFSNSIIIELYSKFAHCCSYVVDTFQMQSNIFGSIAVELAGVRSVVSLQESKVIDEVSPLVKKVLYRLINVYVTGWIKATGAVSHVFKYELVSQ